MTFNKTSKKVPILFCILLFVTIFTVTPRAQMFSDTMWVRVTFYDFHADGSNPEFNPDHQGGIYSEMVEQSLSPALKPIVGSKPFFNYYIDKWFKPWKPGDFTIPTYTDIKGTYGNKKTVSYDTAFKNIVIVDSLPFIHVSDAVYQFERSGLNGTSQFFWIDGKGFGNEPSGFNHNYSFTMELHTQFTYQKGLHFDFLGDDDVWAFVNGKLVMDLGGIHSSAAGTVKMDSIGKVMNLVEGTKYPFDLFYAERHTIDSRIKITTNMITHSSGPQVSRAVVNPGVDPAAPDTLTISFNSLIDCYELTAAPPESAFVYIDDNKSSTTVLGTSKYLGTCETQYINSVKILVTNKTYLNSFVNDSIGFRIGSVHVTNVDGVHPFLPVKAHVGLNTDIGFQVSPYPVPASPDKEIDSRIRSSYGPIIGTNTYGSIVGVYSKVPFVSLSGNPDAFGKADIYDATGNIVQHDLLLKSAGREGIYGVYWNLKNRNERIVGNGTYLMIIKATYVGGQKTQQRVKMAVRR